MPVRGAHADAAPSWGEVESMSTMPATSSGWLAAKVSA